MVKILLVGLGGFLGSVLRYLATGWVQTIAGGGFYPYGTFAVNMAGCLLIGFLAGFSQDKGIWSAELKLFVFFGFLGGFTTFSTFANESFQLISDDQFTAGLLNVGFHILLGLVFVWVGYFLSNLISS